MESRWIWPFELLDKLGEGGMGVVYRARYVGNDRHVAVKLLPSDAAANTTLLARFEREMEVLKQLRHPNIVHCFGGTCESEQRFYAMELIEGGTLSDVIRSKGRLSLEVALDFAIQMCHALQYAHERGVIHRDIKPSNFLMTKRGQIKLSDFGLVTIVAGRRLTATGRTMGTVEYMSPEQIRGKPALTHRSDLYALGCVIFEMLTGKPPYQGESAVEIMHKHLKEPVPHLSLTRFDGPRQLDQLVFELLSKTPERRPGSAKEVGELLEDMLHPGRRAGRFESTLLPTKTPVASVVAPLEGIDRSSDSLPEISTTIDQFRSPWSWSIAACLVVICLISWNGWRTSSSRIAQAEHVLVNQLDSPDQTTRLFAANTLAKLGPLHPNTIGKLHAATKSGRDETIIAALAALSHHANECRSLQWDIYKMQQNSELSSAVRAQAGQTFNEIQQSRSSSTTMTILFWSFLVALMVVAVVGGRWIWSRVRLLAHSNPSFSGAA